MKTFYVSRYSRHTWIDSYSKCKDFGLEFASFDSLEEFQTMKKLCSNTTSTNFTVFIHVGGATLNGGSLTDWYWITTGEKISYKMPWLKGEPNNHKKNEFCLSVGLNEFYFNDIDCMFYDKLMFMCQKIDKLNSIDSLMEK